MESPKIAAVKQASRSRVSNGDGLRTGRGIPIQQVNCNLMGCAIIQTQCNAETAGTRRVIAGSQPRRRTTRAL